jgi:hypothetical protein
LPVRALHEIGAPAERWVSVDLPVGDAPAHCADGSHPPCVARSPEEVQQPRGPAPEVTLSSGAGRAVQCAMSPAIDAADSAARS